MIRTYGFDLARGVIDVETFVRLPEPFTLPTHCTGPAQAGPVRSPPGDTTAHRLTRLADPDQLVALPLDMGDE